MVQMKELKTFGNIPIDNGVLKSILTDYQSPNMKIRLLQQQGALIQLKRGLYVVSPEFSGKQLSLGLIANHIYGPSYVSLHYALRYYGLIAERVYTITSITTHHTRTFENSLARFTYRGVGTEYFPIGVRSIDENGVSYLMATPEKALCDMIMVEPYIPQSSILGLERFFEEDMRIDMDALRDMDINIIKSCMETGKKKNILNNLLKLINR